MNRLLVLIFIVFVVGCEQKSHQDVVDFIENGKRQPPGKIPPLPVFTPYKPHVYDAAGFRSPFEPPAVVEKKILAAKSNVKPDLNRPKQRLENYDFTSLTMVGSIAQSGVLWALIQDPEGSIERVREGYYLGRNHGRIIDMTELQIDVVEIVPDGVDGWLERPNAIRLKGEN